MILKFITIIIFFCISTFGFSQTFQTSEFGTYISKYNSDSLLTFENPNAIIVEDYYDYHFNDMLIKNYYEIERKVKIKICNKIGNDVANIKIPYISYKNFEKITNIEAITINKENNILSIIPLDVNTIYNQEQNKYISQIAFTFPSVNDSSTLEYKFTIRRKSSLLIPPTFNHQKYPTHKIFIYKEKDKIVTSLQYQGFARVKTYFVNKTKLNSEVQENSKCNRILHYIEKVLPVKNENYMDGNVENYITKISLKAEMVTSNKFTELLVSPTWENIANQLLNNPFLGNVDCSKLKIDSIKNKIDNIKDTIQKITTIFNFVKAKFIKNNQTGIFCEDIQKVWESNTGSTTEINVILNYILNSCDIPCSLVVGKYLKYGRIDKNEANLYELDFVGCIATYNENVYILDASNKYNLYNEYPKEIITTDVLILSTKEWVSLWNEKSTYNQSNVLEATILDNKKILINLTMTSKGYERLDRIELWKKNKADFEDKYLKSNTHNLDSIEILKTIYHQDSSEFIQKVKFLYTPNVDEKYIYFDFYNLIPNFIYNPFVDEKRVTPINFYGTKNYVSYLKLNKNNSYKINSTLYKGELKNADNTMTYVTNVESREKDWIFFHQFQIFKPLYIKEEYNIVREYFKNLVSVASLPILVEKK